ncbi:hypothetical protein IE81DRAFT_325441 [Ceraceosorus guamensis]|uniref:Uncharacterized protein n=1 Tax=Ceraceosorus guamensis TaxID=1522189 RepID=A0A316VW86_9BASI|nr:hypothetical protein IE81DRAFT_325441 [Ceraceosorus guamensis]PWN40571.1 hypothetical protein IE81DRAFT_325441 [Ceraceosorus guamensis]
MLSRLVKLFPSALRGFQTQAPLQVAPTLASLTPASLTIGSSVIDVVSFTGPARPLRRVGMMPLPNNRISTSFADQFSASKPSMRMHTISEPGTSKAEEVSKSARAAETIEHTNEVTNNVESAVSKVETSVQTHHDDLRQALEPGSIIKSGSHETGFGRLGESA